MSRFVVRITGVDPDGTVTSYVMLPPDGETRDQAVKRVETINENEKSVTAEVVDIEEDEEAED